MKKIYYIIKQLRLKLRQWNKEAELAELDMDIQCGAMSYRDYCAEYKEISDKYKDLEVT